MGEEVLTVTAPLCPPRADALILCGGRSRRMGRDKVLLPLEGRTLLQRAVDFWRSVPGVDRILAAVGTEEHRPALPAGVIPVYDRYPGCGPLAGLHAAFTQTDAALLYVSAVDMPFLTPETLPPLPAGDVSVFAREGRPLPLPGVYRRSVLPALENALAAGQYRLRDLLGTVATDCTPLPPGGEDALRNLNTPADLWRALAGSPPAVVCMGWSGSGKTTFLEKLLPALAARGVRAAVIKHDAHGFQMDKPGKDSWRFARAGAAAVAISGPNGWAVLGPDPIGLEELKAKLPPAELILVEGHKGSPYPKFQVYRRAVGKDFIPDDGTQFAVISDDDIPGLALPRLGLDDADGCAELLLRIFLGEKGDRA